MKKLAVMLLTIIATLISNQTHAASQWCQGTISHAYIAKNGTLYIKSTWRNDYTALCNVNQTRDGVSVDVCKSWLSVILTGKTTQAPMIVYYANAPACNTIPSYEKAPSPGYVMLSS